MTKTKKMKAVAKAFGILNAYGEFWTYTTFYTEEEARNYISDYELKYGMIPNHTVIPVIISEAPRKEKNG